MKELISGHGLLPVSAKIFLVSGFLQELGVREKKGLELFYLLYSILFLATRGSA